MRLKKMNICSIFVLCTVVLLNTIIIISTINKKDIKEDYFRIHILANSNSIEDQSLKYAVTNSVNKYIEGLYEINKTNYTKNNAKQIIQNNIYPILDIANKTIKEKKYNYSVIAKIGNMYYDKKTNNEIEMAKGTYDSLQIIIGEGKGNNFWSLLYPYSYVGNIELDIYNEGNTINTDYIMNCKNTKYSFGIYELIKNIFK